MLTLKYAAREMARVGGGSFVAISSIAATTVHRWFGAPADVAEAARFLAGPESAWITGEVINVDGGQHLRRGPDYAAVFEPMFGAAALRGLPEEGP